MKFGRFAATYFLAVSSFAASGVAPTKPELATMYDKAAGELAANHIDKALQELDAIDARQPGLAEVQNLRGVVAMEQGEYDQAEAEFRKALGIDPKLLHAAFNLADIPFLKKDWAQARARFEALLKRVPGELRETIVPLIEYKILLTVLFQNKEEEIGAILSKLKGWNGSPAFAYAEAAIALYRHKQKESSEWMAAAEKDFSAQENKLFLESFYEVGWLQRPPGEARSVADFSSPAARTAPASANAQANFEQAKRAFETRDFDRALKFLDRTDESAPDPTASDNLRAQVLLEQNKFDEAEAALQKAARTDPASWEARYILAQISFRKKDYAEARARLEALLGEAPSGIKNQTSLAGQRPALQASVQLIRYQIFLTLLLEGNESAAQQRMEQFKFTDETPALYYAQAAWSFQHKNSKQASEWIASAGKLFSPALNSAFANSLADLGWLGEQRAGPASTQAAPSPQPAPVLVPNPANSPPVPVVAEGQITAPPMVTRITPSSDSSPAASASAERKTSSPAGQQSLGETKKKRRRQRAKPTVAMSPASPAARTGTRRATPVDSAALRAAVALSPAGPAATPRPPFLDRLARTLLRPFKRRNQKSDRGDSGQVAGSPAASNGATPVPRRPRQN